MNTRFSRRLPIRLQLGALGYSDNDYPGSFNDPVQFVDVNGNPVAPPVTENPVTGEQSFDPTVLILQNSANVPREYQFDMPYQPESGYWQTIPGVRSGAIPATGGNVAVVVRPQDMQTPGVLRVVGGETAQTRATAGTYVGPIRPVTSTPTSPAPRTSSIPPIIGAGETMTGDAAETGTKTATTTKTATGPGVAILIALALSLMN